MAGETITLSDGEDWCSTFRSEYPGATKAYYYSKSNIESIIDQSGCTYLRIYRAVDAEENDCLVLVGADSSKDDMTGGTLMSNGDPCPSTCDTDSSLYS